MAFQEQKTPAKQQWSPTTPWVKSDKKTLLDWPKYVCRNPSCKSYGRSHPNCRCGAPGTTGMAEGGEVHFCSQMSTHAPECEHFADGGQVQQNMELANNPELSLDHAVVSHGLLHLLTKTGHSKSEDPMRTAHDHMDHIKSGRDKIEHHSKNIFEKSDKVDENKDHIKALKEHIEDLQANPHKLLDVGGSLADNLPDHAGALGAKTAAVMNHFQLIKPKARQSNPMSEPLPPSKGDEAFYNRQMALAQNPTLIYNEIKNGTLSPGDTQTVAAIYPKLYEKMRNQTTESLIEAKTNEKKISYKHRIGLGMLLGQPLDYSQSPQAMQAIIASNGPSQGRQQNRPQKKSGATAAELKQIDKVDSMYETPNQARLIDKKI